MKKFNDPIERLIEYYRQVDWKSREGYDAAAGLGFFIAAVIIVFVRR